MKKFLVLLCLLVFLPLHAQKFGGKIGTASPAAGTPGSGTVTSVGNGTIGPLFSGSWATATTTPAFSLNFAAQVANCVIAGPASAGPTVPTCRALVSADIPANAANTSGTASNVSGTPALPNGTTATTQSQADASTKLATTAYVDTGLGTKAPTANPAFTGQPTTSIGTGTATGNISGTYAKFVSGAGVGNAANTSNNALWTLTAVPANSFTANGDALILTLTGLMGGTTNNKAVGATVGGTQITGTVVTSNALPWLAILTITRVDVTHVNLGLVGISGVSPFGVSSMNLVVSDLTANTLAVVVTGASPTTGAANDVKLHSGVAEFKK